MKIKITSTCVLDTKEIFTKGLSDVEVVNELNQNNGENAFSVLSECAGDIHEKSQFVCKAEEVT